MLSESFVASFLTSNNQQISPALKDVGICLHEFQPAQSLRLALKKSSTDSNCLAVGSSHIFASQAGKAVVHVYSREKSNQEATVPFPERIRSLALAGGLGEPGLLVLGTEGGRLIVWEVSERLFEAFATVTSIQITWSLTFFCRHVQGAKYRRRPPTYNPLPR